MKNLRLLLFTAASFIFLLAACSQTPEVQEPGLEPQFGTRGYDSVEDIALGNSGTLYAIGLWDSNYDPRDETSEFDDDEYPAIRESFLRRYDRAGSLLWEKYFEDSPGYDYWPYTERRAISARAVVTDDNGNAIVAWSAYYYEYNGSYYPDLVAKFHYLSKYAPNGVQLWRTNTNEDRLIDLDIDSSGNIFGVSNNPYAEYLPIPPNSSVSGNALIKYSTGGAKVWEKPISHESPNGQRATPNGVAISSANNIYVICQNGVLDKYRSGGNKLWSKAIKSETERIQNYKLAAGLNDELYISGGYQYKYIEGGGCDEGGYTAVYYARLYAFTSNGTLRWIRNAAQMQTSEDGCSSEVYGWEPRDGLNVASDTLGNAYIVGGNGQGNGFVVKYSRSGARAWSKQFTSGNNSYQSRSEGATSVATYNGNEIYVGALTYDSLVHRNIGGSDAVLRKMNKYGNRVWTR